MTQVARIYGESLYALACDEQIGEEILIQLQEVKKLLKTNPEYVEFLAGAAVSKKERCDTLDECFRGQIHPYLLNFLKLLTENGTIRQIFGCEEAYRRHYYSDNGIAEVVVTSAVELTDQTLSKLRDRLQENTGKIVYLETRIDPGVMGGIRLEMDGKRIDGTIANRLAEMKSVLREKIL